MLYTTRLCYNTHIHIYMHAYIPAYRHHACIDAFIHNMYMYVIQRYAHFLLIYIELPNHIHNSLKYYATNSELLTIINNNYLYLKGYKIIHY